MIFQKESQLTYRQILKQYLYNTSMNIQLFSE